MNDFRCKKCHKLLAKIEDSIPVKARMDLVEVKENSTISPTEQRQEDTVVHIRCPKCKTMNSRVKSIEVIIEM